MDKLKYTSGLTGAEFDLNGPVVFVGTGGDLRSRSWNYDIEYSGISGVSRSTRECSVTISSTSKDEIDAIENAFDADFAAKKPGLLTLNDDLVAQIFVPKSEASVIAPQFVSLDLTLLLLDGVWVKKHEFCYPRGVESEYPYLDLPTDAPFDLKPMGSFKMLENSGFSASPFKLTIYGPATSPSLFIGGNRYEVDVSVDEGGLLIVDSFSRPKTIKLFDIVGNEIDVFSKGKRGEGSYIFERITAGKSDVSWDGSFGFDLELFEERSGLPWT